MRVFITGGSGYIGQAVVKALRQAPGLGELTRRAQEDADSISPMFLVTTSMVRPSSSVGLNSTTSVPA